MGSRVRPAAAALREVGSWAEFQEVVDRRAPPQVAAERSPASTVERVPAPVRGDAPVFRSDLPEAARAVLERSSLLRS